MIWKMNLTFDGIKRLSSFPNIHCKVHTASDLLIFASSEMFRDDGVDKVAIRVPFESMGV